MLQELLSDGKIIYTVPSHALIADMLKEFEYLTYKFKVTEGASNFSSWKNSDVIVTQRLNFCIELAFSQKSF